MGVFFYQRVGDRSSMRAGFGQTGGSCTDTLLVRGGEERDAVLELLGDVEPYAATDAKFGALNRTLAKSHPQWAWMICTNIDTVQGIGHTPFDEDVSNANGAIVGDKGHLETVDTEYESPPFDERYWQYPVYEFTCKFESVNYQPLQDDTVTVRTATAYDDDGTSYSYTYPDGEWLRFTDYTITPSAELITAQQGQSIFVRTTGSVSPSATAAPHGFTFAGMPRILIAKSTVKFSWYKIPLSYLTHVNSRLINGLGHVNQDDWFSYPAGSLLYIGLIVDKRYVPPIPSITQTWGGRASPDPVSEKLIDVTLLLEYVDRTASQVPDFANTANTNLNFIAAGHNLDPWFGDRKFYTTVYPGGPTLVISGTAAAGATNTVTLDGSASNTSNTYNSMSIRIVGNPDKTITSYNGTTKVASIANATFSTAPTAGTAYSIYSSTNTTLNDVTRWRPKFPSIPFRYLFGNPESP